MGPEDTHYPLGMITEKILYKRRQVTLVGVTGCLCWQKRGIWRYKILRLIYNYAKFPK